MDGSGNEHANEHQYHDHEEHDADGFLIVMFFLHEFKSIEVLCDLVCEYDIRPRKPHTGDRRDHRHDFTFGDKIETELDNAEDIDGVRL